MTNFTYAAEWAFQDYLQNTVTASLTYPILKGHSDDFGDSFDYPKISVCLEGYEEVIPYSGVFRGELMIDIASNAFDSASFWNHDLAVDQISKCMADQNGIINWINSPSSSIYIAGVPNEGVRSMFEGNNFMNSHKFGLFAQQMKPSSSYSSFGH